MSDVKLELSKTLFSEGLTRREKIVRCKKLLQELDDPQEAMDCQVTALKILQEQAYAQLLVEWNGSQQGSVLSVGEKEFLDDPENVLFEMRQMPVNDLLAFFLWYFADHFDEVRLNDAKGRMADVAFKVLLTKWKLADRWNT